MVTRYFILCAGTTGLFWRPESRGYTTNLAEAGIYEEKEARGIAGLGRGDSLVAVNRLVVQHEIEDRTKTISRLQEENRNLRRLLKKLEGTT